MRPIAFPNGETVKIIRAGVKTDPFSGEETEDWDNPTITPYDFCAVSHGPSSEDWLVGRNPVDIALTVFMPYAADVTVKDRAEVRGVVYDVYGDPFKWSSPFTADQPGTELALKARLG
jgi:hypothetical protein